MEPSLGETNEAAVIDQLLVSGAAVAVRGRAIVLLDDVGPGLSALVDALVDDGALRYAHGYVPIDVGGHVHPVTLEPSADPENEIRVVQAPAPIGVIARLTHREGVGLALHECSSDEAGLAVLAHARGADARLEFALGIARAAVRDAALLVGEWDRPDHAAAALMEVLARVVRRPLQQSRSSPAMEFAGLVLQLEGKLARLAEALGRAEIQAVLVNGDEVRAALAHRFALAFSAVVEVPRSQVPRAFAAMESAGWRPVPGEGGRRYFQEGATVRLVARPRLPLGRERREAQAVRAGRLGFAEPDANLDARKAPVAPVPVPFDPGGRVRTSVIAELLTLSAEGLTVLDTLRLRTRERDFRGLDVQYGPGVHAFQPVLERLVAALLARLPDDHSGLRVIDVGTGTGIVALSVARERPDVEVLATDVSLRALGWARRNRRRLGLRNVHLAQGSLLAPVPTEWRGQVAAIVASVPIALPAETAEFRTVDWPLGTATGAGADGLGLVRALARDARDVLAPGGFLLAQLLAEQGRWIADDLQQLGFEAEIPTADGGGIEVVARWPG